MHNRKFGKEKSVFFCRLKVCATKYCRNNAYYGGKTFKKAKVASAFQEIAQKLSTDKIEFLCFSARRYNRGLCIKRTILCALSA